MYSIQLRNMTPMGWGIAVDNFPPEKKKVHTQKLMSMELDPKSSIFAMALFIHILLKKNPSEIWVG